MAGKTLLCYCTVVQVGLRPCGLQGNAHSANHRDPTWIQGGMEAMDAKLRGRDDSLRLTVSDKRTNLALFKQHP
jgi:hypothetical protein